MLRQFMLSIYPGWKVNFLCLTLTLWLGSILFTYANAEESSVSTEQLQHELAQSREMLIKLNEYVQELETKVDQIASESSSEKDDTADRLDSLEETVFDIDERVGSRAVVHAFEGLSLDIGGFIHSTYTAIDSEDGSATGFNRQNFELLISAEFNKNWSAFFAGGFLRESDNPFAVGSRLDPEFNSVNKNPQIIAWANYEYNDALNVRIGRFITPHGVINIQHFPAVLLEPEQPQFLRPFGSDTIFPNFSTGVQTHGSMFFGSEDAHRFEYYTYISNPNIGGANEEEIYGTRSAVTIGDTGLTMGVNLADGGRANGSDYSLYGADILYDKGRFLLKSEVFSTSESDEFDDRFAFYVQPAWRFTPKWTAFYRYDFLDNGFTDSVENVVGLNYLPHPSIRLRATATYADYDDGFGADGSFLPDAQAGIFQLSGTFSF